MRTLPFLNRKKSSGFTLIELLVVIAIIGVLTGLVITNVMSVRQAARRLQCQNKMRQFGIALTLYESAYQHFPSGKTSEPKYSGFSWSAQLLPWLEEEPLWNSLVEFEDAAAIDGIPVNRLGLSTHQLHVHCPSNSETATVQRAMNLNGTYVGLTDYQGVAGRNFRSKDGVFFLDSKTKISQIGDGLSNTFFIGERPPSSDYSLGWWFTGNRQDGTGNADLFLGMEEENAMQAESLKNLGSGPYYYRKGSWKKMESVLHFWSFHPSGANFLYGDGSVNLLSYGTDRTVMLELATFDQ